MKTIIIGLNHAGCAAAQTLLNLGHTNTHIYDKSLEVSFLSCGMALWIGGQLSSGEGLFYASPEDFNAFGARAMTETTIELIDFKNKRVHGHDKFGAAIVDDYDKLILATGSRARPFKVMGAELENVLGSKSYRDAEKAVRLLALPEIQRVVVVGAGYVGVELAEACRRQGKEVTLIDLAPHILYTHADEKFAKLIADRMTSNGIKIRTGERVLAFEGDERVRAVRTMTDEYAADMVFVCAGFEPMTDLGRGVIELGAQSAYKVDKFQRTSQPDVYAAGDCACVYDRSLGEFAYIALASHSVRSGIIAALNAASISTEYQGTQGSSGLCIYDMRLLTTGMSVQTAQTRGIDVEFVDVDEKRYAHAFFSHNPDVHIRLVYRKKDRAIIGAQMASTDDLSGCINMLSLAISKGLTVDSLAFHDVFFMPQLSGLNFFRKAALVAH